MRSRSSVAFSWLRFAWWLHGVAAMRLVVLNRHSGPVEVELPLPQTIAAGASWSTWFKQEPAGMVKFARPQASVAGIEGKYGVVVVTATGEVVTHDTNDLQLEISAAARQCVEHDGKPLWADCLARRAFGGFPEDLAAQAFRDLWGSFQYWSLCNVVEPAAPLRFQTSQAGHRVEILREEPLVATVRGFLSQAQCDEITRSADLSDLVRAHTGVGGGKTATSESRETLTTNMFVNWDERSELTLLAAKSFDLASELYGQRLSYEGQEPINFLHYLRGYEYKPHSDGSGVGRGKRVATTLVYCEAADEGGSTVFTSSESPLKFQPGHGDLLYFQYQPNARLATHAACPVVAGNKTTLTQWYRPDVSLEAYWDQFESWGRFPNPYASTRWHGPRYGEAPVEL